MHQYTLARACTCLRSWTHAHVHACAHACAHAYAHTHTAHLFLRNCEMPSCSTEPSSCDGSLHTRAPCTSGYLCMHVCVRACMCICICVCVCACMCMHVSLSCGSVCTSHLPNKGDELFDRNLRLDPLAVPVYSLLARQHMKHLLSPMQHWLPHLGASIGSTI